MDKDFKFLNLLQGEPARLISALAESSKEKITSILLAVLSIFLAFTSEEFKGI